MLTGITIRNFKTFEEIAVPLGNGFVFVGPNNSGKTSALQALALWHTGLQKWQERYPDRDNIPSQRPGVTVNRVDLIRLPVPETNLIWFNKKVRRGFNENIRIELLVEGVNNGESWRCGLEFDYSNPDSFFCRPLRVSSADNPDRMDIPDEALELRLAFLPPMSGLAAEEALIQEGRINVLMGQGQTAEVLRNLCYRVYEKEEKSDWNMLVEQIRELFGVTLNKPKYLSARGTVIMDYAERDGKTTLDLSSSGRGMQQVLLLLAYLYDNSRNTVFLLDEPDAHLEILRQRQVYDLINDTAEKRGSQIISATHSEVLLNQAAQRKAAVAFIGNKPHILGDNKESRVLAALREIGFEYYYEATAKGWILYLEGETDLRILQAFAARLAHPAERALQNPLVHYIGDDLGRARHHFHSLAEAKNDLHGFLLADRMDKPLADAANLQEYKWRKHEIENYLCSRKAILSWVEARYFEVYNLPTDDNDMVTQSEIRHRRDKMDAEIKKMEQAFSTMNRPDPFSEDVKASDDFLVPLFRNFAGALEWPPSQALQKKDFYKLVAYIPEEEIDKEVITVLNKIDETASNANPYDAE